VVDIAGVQAYSQIASGVVSAYCNGGIDQLTANSSGYFTLTTNCINNLTIYNTVTDEMLYSAAPPTTTVFTAQLNRFVFPTI
jgi:hypothetical protein